MKTLTIKCDISIGEEGFYPKRQLNAELRLYLEQLIENKEFLNLIAKYCEDEKYVKNVQVMTDSICYERNNDDNNSCTFTINVIYDSDYTKRVVKKTIYSNFNHNIRSGGIWQYEGEEGGGEINLALNNLLSNAIYNDEKQELSECNQIDSKRNCDVCGCKAYLYLYDKDNDLFNSKCIEEYLEFNINDHLYPIERGNLYKYKLTDINHNVLKEALFTF